VFRAVGKGWGVLTFALDVLKGAIPAGLFVWGIARLGGPSLSEVWKLGMGLAAIAGHNWPVFLGFKGGKGVATGAGVLLAAAPVEVAIGLAAWIALFLSLRYVSLASIGAAAAVVVAGWLTRPETGGWTFPTVLTLLGALTIWRHRSNLRRLREGTEHRFALGRGAGKRETTP
jgi:glycerol-3-phosphate acyltransferase PlsY